jgi:Ca-activated chloride channel family protein
MHRTLVFVATLTCAAQAPDIHIDVDSVTVGFTVADRDGAPVKDLQRGSFTLLDEGKPREIQSFWQESSLPLTIGLVVDVSGSQTGAIRSHRETILRFLSQVMAPQDRAFIVTVGPQVKLVTDLTSSLDQLRAGVDGIQARQPEGTQLGEPCSRVVMGRRFQGCGGTVLWDGVYASSLLKMKPITGRKALIVLSDGMDTGSAHKLVAAIEAAQSADTLVYTIRALGTMTTFSPAALAITTLNGSMRRLSQETGGRAFGSARNAPETFTTIETELRNLYVLGFTPPEEARSEKFRKIEIRTAAKGLTVRPARDTQ